jgi:hypothetical protein
MVNTKRTGELEAIALDVGLSIGGYEWKEGGLFTDSMSHTPAEDRPEYRAERAYFLQVELSWEMITRDGVVLRAGGGGTGLLNHGDVACVQPASGGTSCGYSPSFFFVLVVGLGFAF